MGIFLVMLAALLDAGGNAIFRNHIGGKGSQNGYLLASYVSSMILAVFLNPHIFVTPFSLPLFVTGLISGALVVLMMLCIRKALSCGPSALTFAYQISGSVFPAVILYLCFGPDFGFTLTKSISCGLLLVLVGLVWATVDSKDSFKEINKNWLLVATAVFFIQIVLFTLMQWRCLTQVDLPNHALLFFSSTTEQDIWFLQGTYIMALILQSLVVYKDPVPMTRQDATTGSIAGIAYGLGTFCLLLATSIASSLEKAILFPAYSIGLIMLCNLWGRMVYKERVNWPAHILSSTGILLASAA